MLSKLTQKHVLQNVVPIVIGLKHMLEQSRSPLMRNMMMYMKTLFHDYRHELADMLAADQRLAKEVEYDLRKYDEHVKANAIIAKANEEAAALAAAESLKNHNIRSLPTTPMTGGKKGKKRNSLGSNLLSTPLAAAAAAISLTPKITSASAPRLRTTPRSNNSSATSVRSAHIKLGSSNDKSFHSASSATPASQERSRPRLRYCFICIHIHTYIYI